MSFSKKLILGTVQLGTKYGIANRHGKPTLAETFSILEAAIANGINMFDTAVTYGDAEDRLGQGLAFLDTKNSSKLITKLDSYAFTSGANCVNEVRHALERLRAKKLHAVLAHSFDQIHKPQTGAALNEIKDRGLADYTGVSVYTASEAIRSLVLPWVDVVQMPLNVFDRQALERDVFGYARQCGKQLYFRSIYLQGLLLLKPEELPEDMKVAAPALKKWHSVCKSFEVLPAHAALQIAAKLSQEFPIVIGCETANQLLQNLEMLQHPVDDLQEIIKEVDTISEFLTEDIVNPSRWPRETLTV